MHMLGKRRAQRVEIFLQHRLETAQVPRSTRRPDLRAGCVISEDLGIVLAAPRSGDLPQRSRHRHRPEPIRPFADAFLPVALLRSWNRGHTRRIERRPVGTFLAVEPDSLRTFSRPVPRSASDSGAPVTRVRRSVLALGPERWPGGLMVILDV
jgi:hypothetical protein